MPTSIEWAANADGSPGETWNPIRARDRVTMKVGTHCVHVSPGCVNCYAERLNMRGLLNNGTGLPYRAQEASRVAVFLDEKMLARPLRRRKPTTWFLSSMTDVFGEFVVDPIIDRLFAVMALCPQHTFIVVTKRAKRMREYITMPATRERIEALAFDMLDANFGGRDAAEEWMRAGGLQWPLPNVWKLVSVEDQPRADERIPDLLATPAAVRGISAEPLLAGFVVDRRHMSGDEEYWDFLRGERGPTVQHRTIRPERTARLNWVIAGGESGPNARPMHPDWARSLRDQCKAAGVPFFFKQWGEWTPCTICEAGLANSHRAGMDGHGVDNQKEQRLGVDGWPHPEGAPILRLGKHRSGRLLDGVEHNARPPFNSQQGEVAAATAAASPGKG